MSTPTSDRFRKLTAGGGCSGGSAAARVFSNSVKLLFDLPFNGPKLIDDGAQARVEGGRSVLKHRSSRITANT
jgi:hypothetical protein